MSLNSLDFLRLDPGQVTLGRQSCPGDEKAEAFWGRLQWASGFCLWDLLLPSSWSSLPDLLQMTTGGNFLSLPDSLVSPGYPSAGLPRQTDTAWQHAAVMQWSQTLWQGTTHIVFNRRALWKAWLKLSTPRSIYPFSQWSGQGRVSSPVSTIQPSSQSVSTFASSLPLLHTLSHKSLSSLFQNRSPTCNVTSIPSSPSRRRHEWKITCSQWVGEWLIMPSLPPKSYSRNLSGFFFPHTAQFP